MGFPGRNVLPLVHNSRRVYLRNNSKVIIILHDSARRVIEQAHILGESPLAIEYELEQQMNVIYDYYIRECPPNLNSTYSSEQDLTIEHIACMQLPNWIQLNYRLEKFIPDYLPQYNT